LGQRRGLPTAFWQKIHNHPQQPKKSKQPLLSKSSDKKSLKKTASNFLLEINKFKSYSNNLIPDGLYKLDPGHAY